MLDFKKKLILKRINKTLDLSLLKGIDEKLNIENSSFQRRNYELEILNLGNILSLINDYDKPVKTLKKLLIPIILYLIYFLICKLFALYLGIVSILLVLFFILLGIAIYFLWEINEEYLIYDSFNLLVSLLNGDEFNIKSYDFKLIDNRLCSSTFDALRLRVRCLIAKLFHLEYIYYVFEYDKDLSSVFEVKLIQDENLLNGEVKLSFNFFPTIIANEYTFSGFGKSLIEERDIESLENLSDDRYSDGLDGDRYEE